jgi:hypothetical protein
VSESQVGDGKKTQALRHRFLSESANSENVGLIMLMKRVSYRECLDTGHEI